MEMERVLIIIGGLLLLIIFIAIVVLYIIPYFVPGLFRSSPSPTPVVVVSSPLPSPRVASPSVAPATSPTPSPTAISTTITYPTTQPLGYKLFSGRFFILSYPANWTILTCANSDNLEFDPIGKADTVGVICDFAQKPITVILQNNLSGCIGNAVTIGRYSVVKGISVTPSYTEYQWCTVAQPVLNITHRVDSTSSRGVGAINFEKEIESIITTLQFTSAQVNY